MKVKRGVTLDGLGRYYKETIKESTEKPIDVVAELKAAKVDVVICYLPVGSEEAAKFYAQCAIDAGGAFVNALPVFIASNPEWADKFTQAGLPIVGDDIKSQVGATITHRIMTKLFQDRGVHVDRTYQLNVGGNMDFKRITKNASVYLPVYHKGGLLYIGDGHAAQGDGEINLCALETSLDYDFVVQLIKKPVKPIEYPK